MLDVLAFRRVLPDENDLLALVTVGGSQLLSIVSLCSISSGH